MNLKDESERQMLFPFLLDVDREERLNLQRLVQQHELLLLDRKLDQFLPAIVELVAQYRDYPPGPVPLKWSVLDSFFEYLRPPSAAESDSQR